LKGYLPDEIGFLYDLEIVYLAQNTIEGSIPSSIGNLSELRHFNIWRNRLSGDLPSELWTLSKLESIDLGGNGGITGVIPQSISKLTKLDLLGLWGNKLSGPIPDQLGEVLSLSFLYLSDNNLEGEIPASFGNLEELEIAYMSRNQFSGTLPDIFSTMLSLKELGLNQNQLSGPLPPSLALAPNIDRIWMWGNNFSGCYPQSYIDNLCNIAINDFGLNPLLPFHGDFNQICDNGASQDFDGDGVCIPLDCDDNDAAIGGDSMPPMPIDTTISLSIHPMYGDTYIYGSEQLLTAQSLPIDDCTPNANLVFAYSTDSLSFSEFLQFDCNDLGSHKIWVSISDYGTNTTIFSITIDIVDNSIPQSCPCTDEKMIVNDTVFAPLYSAVMDIMDLGTMIGGDSVKYQAGNSISLNPVFVVPQNHVFIAEIDDCNN